MSVQNDLKDLSTILSILKIDSTRLYERIKYRVDEYMGVFALRRTRVQFKEIFQTRYKEIPMQDLKSCGEEIIMSMDNYYSKASDLSWYLDNTEDMPSTAKDKVLQYISEIDGLYDALNVEIDKKSCEIHGID
jgi:hypothetical protein